MPPNEDSNDWLGDLKWMGYPRLAPIRDAVAAADAAPDSPRPLRTGGNVRAEALARENEALRAKLEALAGFAADFERRLSEAAAAYEGAALDYDTARRSAELDNARLSGELEAARSELARREARELARAAEFSLERERRADCEKGLLEAKRKVNDLEIELAATRSKAGELSGSISELRRQAEASHARLLQAKALTDQDVHLLRSEMREFLAKFHRIQESLAPPTLGENK
jgi:chromosome segregation ATPase